MTIHNNTSFTPADIAQMKYLGTVQSEWTGRSTKLYADPETRGNVVSVGVDFKARIVTVNSVAAACWDRELGALATSPVVVMQ